MDEKHGRVFDPLLKKEFQNFLKEITDYKTSKLNRVEAQMKRKQMSMSEENRFKEAEKMMTSLLRKVASRKLRQKASHRDK